MTKFKMIAYVDDTGERRYKHSPEFIEFIRTQNTGRRHTLTAKQAISKRFKGKPQNRSPEVRRQQVQKRKETLGKLPKGVLLARYARHSKLLSGRKLSQGHREAIATSLQGHIVTSETRRKIAAAHANKPLSPEVCQILSRAQTKRILRYGYTNKRNDYKTGYFWSEKAGSRLWYASSLEEAAYNQLENDPSVSSFDRCRFCVPYIDREGKRRRYIPDIFVTYCDDLVKVVEVKCGFFCDKDNNPDKLAAGERFCQGKGWGYEVWTEKELGFTYAK